MTHKWTLMVYMAGDNGKMFDDGEQLFADLQKYGWRDLEDMSEVGSTAEVAIAVQYDTLDNRQYTPRLFIDGSNSTGQLVEKIPPVNTGDPKNLTDFIVWAETNYPAERYALVLWNHGTGWKEEDIYARYRERVERAIRGGETRAGGRGERLLRRALFLPTVGEIMSIEDDDVRAICYDDSSMDFLDNQELVKAFRDAEAQTGQHLSVLGMDACLMSMVEVAYQVRNYVDYMVGSQEVEQAEGWPYKEILTKLVSNPEISALDLSRLIVEEFGEYYMGSSRSGGGKNTQSAIDLRVTPQTFVQIKALSDLVAEVYLTDWNTERAVGRIRHEVQKFRDQDYVDLRHLMQLLKDEYYGDLGVDDLAHNLTEHLATEEPGGPIVANFHGSGCPNANGLSIYFPATGCSPFYEKQAFALSGWNRVIRRANRL
jgi:hypothetical protein